MDLIELTQMKTFSASQIKDAIHNTFSGCVVSVDVVDMGYVISVAHKDLVAKDISIKFFQANDFGINKILCSQLSEAFNEQTDK